MNGPTVSESQAGQILGQTITLGKTDKALILVTNKGAIEAGKDISVHTSGLSNIGSLVANDNATVSASGHVLNGGTIGSGKNLTLNATSYTASASAAYLSSGILTVDLKSGALSNAGTIYGSTSLTLTSDALMNQGNTSAIGGLSTAITTHGDLSNEGQISANSGLSLTVHGAVANAGTITTDHLTSVEGYEPDPVDGGLILAADGAVSSSGTLVASGQLTINSASLSNTSTAAQIGGNSTAVTLSGAFSNKGIVDGGTSLDIKSLGFSNGPSDDKTYGIVLANSFVIDAVAGSVTDQGILQATKDG